MNYTKGPYRIFGSGDGKASNIEGKGEIVEPVAIIPHDDITDEGLEEARGNISLITHADQMYELLCQIYVDMQPHNLEVGNLLKEIHNG